MKTMTEKLILEALFYDDCALTPHMESAFQLTVNKFAEAFCLFDLTISLGKSGVLLQLSPPTTVCCPSISIEETDQKSVEEFKYCRSIISNNDHLEKVINTRIC